MNLTADTTLHVVAEGPAGEVIYGAITGTNGGSDIALTTTDLTTTGVVTGFALPPMPVDPLGSFAPGVLDERPTDALWQDGHLWFVSTAPITHDAGVTYNDAVRVVELSTGGTVTLVQDLRLGLNGLDAYLGGIGLSQVGGLYVVYTESNASIPATLVASFQSPLTARGQVSGNKVLAFGQTGYKGSRWGDYVGVATDPVDPYAVWQAGEYTNAAGSWSTRVSMLTEDRTPPRVTVPGVRIPVPGTAATTTIPVTVSWAGSDDFSGIALYELQASVGGAAWTPIALPGLLTTSVARSLIPGTSYRVRVRATDIAGNVGAWSVSPLVTPLVTAETNAAVRYAGTWYLGSLSGAVGGRVRYAYRLGATASYRFSGRQIAWLAPKSVTRGSARVYVDGVYRATVSLYATTTRARQLVFSYAWASTGTHTIKILVLGTNRHSRVDLDAFVLLR